MACERMVDYCNGAYNRVSQLSNESKVNVLTKVTFGQGSPLLYPICLV
jgi:hypothetical protein